MKVDGPGSTRAASSTKKTSKANKSGGAGFARAMNAGAQEEAAGAAVSGTGPAGAVDALLALQQVDDVAGNATGGGSNAQGQAWGRELLDLLDEIRTGLLIGAIPRHDLQRLAESVAKKQGDVADPRLADILSEIEVRARVELAKYQR